VKVLGTDYGSSWVREFIWAPVKKSYGVHNPDLPKVFVCEIKKTNNNEKIHASRHQVKPPEPKSGAIKPRHGSGGPDYDSTDVNKEKPITQNQLSKTCQSIQRRLYKKHSRPRASSP
jgi:hypothetical protein